MGDRGSAAGARPGLLPGSRGSGRVPDPDPEDRPHPPGPPGSGAARPAAVHGAGPHRPAQPGAHRDHAQQGQEGLPPLGAGPHPHPHGPPDDSGLAGAPLALPPGHHPPSGRSGRSGGQPGGPGGAGPRPAPGARPGAAHRQGWLRLRQCPGHESPGPGPGDAPHPGRPAGGPHRPGHGGHQGRHAGPGGPATGH